LVVKAHIVSEPQEAGRAIGALTRFMPGAGEELELTFGLGFGVGSTVAWESD
jgi:hypothetical protein